MITEVSIVERPPSAMVSQRSELLTESIESLPDFGKVAREKNRKTKHIF